jgi:predicted RNA-binding Zn ribbon-like protein
MPWPPRFIFIGSSLAIDFAQTGGEGFRARWESWHVPSDLEDWAEASPELGIRPDATHDDLAASRALREALWHTARRQLEHRPPASGDLALIEAHAAAPDLVPILRDGHRRWSAPASFPQVLSAVARDAIHVFGTPLVERFRECANPLCSLMFVDRSRPGMRQWCSMERCGNLTKVARYRAKAKGDDHAR